MNILDFNPKKLSIEKVCAINDEQEHIYYIKYGRDPFYLVINDLKGYFKYSKEKKIQQSSSERNSRDHGIRDHGIIIFDTHDTLPLEDIVSIYSITIIIRSVYRDYYDRFYPQIHLENFIYKKC